MEGLRQALEKAGGVRALARALGLRSHTAVRSWREVPQARVFDVERVSGVAAEVLRPDLIDWIRAERYRRTMERARARMGLASGPLSGMARVKGPEVVTPTSTTVFELGLVIASLKWAAHARGLKSGHVLRSNEREAQSARAYGIALAYVVLRLSSTVVGGVVGTSRQNVENIGERYLRARDGDGEADADDPDFDPGMAGYVIERGRMRRRKDGNDGFWAQERQFMAWVEGGCE